jgi:uncharacterized protein (DUF2267 family)
MEYVDFIVNVQSATGISDRDDAVRLSRAVLKTFNERTSRTEKDELSSQLPCELKDMLNEKVRVHRYNLEQFYNQVAHRAGISYPESIGKTNAVMMVLQEAVSPGELSHILRELPKEYLSLFGRKTATDALSPGSLTTMEEKQLAKRRRS